MENQSSQPHQSPPVDLQSPERKVIRRRFVQSTLFPLKSHDNKAEICIQKEVKNVVEIDGEDEICGSQGGKRRAGRKGSAEKKRGKKVNDDKLEIEEEEDGDDVEEICGSQGSKRKRGRRVKGNSTPTKRGFKKGALNGKDASFVAIDEIDSPDDGSPQQLNQKQRVSTRNGKTNGNKALSFSKVSTNPAAIQQFSQPVPDLWQEAKKTAEENSRISAGKQIHPFFSLWKVGKKDMETIDLESYGSLDKRKGRSVEFGPIHVFENVKDESDPINWCNWTFDDSIQSKTCNQDTKVFPLEGTIGSSSNFDDLLSDSKLPTSIPSILADDKVTPFYPLISIEKIMEVSEACIYDCSGITSSCLDPAVPQERVMSYCLNRGDYPENSLWTNKYHPEKALEVCGNSEAVRFINDWLRLWHEMDFRFSRSSCSVEKCSMKDDEYEPCGSDSYSENLEPSGLKNVLLVTGPVGCGKTAAIYACAKEQGFQIIEVNASDWRNGALLKQKFGEAVGSHWLKRSQESPKGKLNFKSSPAVTTIGPSTQILNDSGVISLLEEEDYVGDIGSQYHSNGGISCDKADIKTLILFEDVDVNLSDDRGLISTIQQLADTGKRPMILTSNNESPLLPDNLDREEVCFSMPSQEELAQHIQRVCSAEKASIRPDLIDRCAELCRGDIRKTLMLLQFWCQSKECIRDGKAQRISGAVMFNVEACHCLLPKVIPWELPSLLSEFVEAEVAKSFTRMEENNSFLGVIEEEEVDDTGMEDELDLNTDETASIEAKKEAILNGNCFVHVDDDIIVGCNTELSNSSGSPVAFTRRNVRRKAAAVMSDSEDEICNHESQAVFKGLMTDAGNAHVPVVHSQFSALHMTSDGILNNFGEQLHDSGALQAEAARLQSSEPALVNHIDFFAPRDSHNQSTNPFVLPSEANNQHIGFGQAKFSSFGEANNSSNLLNHLVLYSGDGDIVFNMNQSSSMHHDPRNLLQDEPFTFGEPNGLEKGIKGSANLSLNAVDDSFMVGSPRDLSTGGKFNLCIEHNMAKHQQSSLGIETVNHSGILTAGASFDQVFEQLNCCSKANTENNEQQCHEKIDDNPLCYKSLGDSLNTSNGHMYHFVEAKEKEILHQHAEVDDCNQYHCAASDDSLNQLAGQFLDTGIPEKSQEQNPLDADAKYASCLQLNDSLKLFNEQPSEVRRGEFFGHQLPDVGIVDLKCSAVGNYLNPLDGDSMKVFETKTEEHQCQYSDATNVNQLFQQCQSVDMSYVPESTFVPETEVNDGTECPSVPDLMEIVSPVTIGNVETSVLGCESTDYKVCGIDLNENARDVDEEMGDSLVENDHQPSTSGCPVMDECSRIDFCKRFKNLRSFEVLNPVQERWNELRQTDLRKYLLSEHEEAHQILELSCRMSHLLSDSDLLLQDREILIDVSSVQDAILNEEPYDFGWHDQHVQMAFAIGQYGYFLCAKDIHALQQKMDLTNKLHLGWEMLVSTRSSTALGKLLSLNTSQISFFDSSMKQAASALDTSFTRERKMCLQNIVESVVPLKSYLTARGNALLDYLSSLAHILKSESSRLADSSSKTKRRRVRVAKNYLSSGALILSEDDILKLNDYNSYGRDSSNLTHKTSR